MQIPVSKLFVQLLFMTTLFVLMTKTKTTIPKLIQSHGSDELDKSIAKLVWNTAVMTNITHIQPPVLDFNET